MQKQGNSTLSFSLVQKYWAKIPVIVQAISTGFVVNTLGVGTWVLAISFLPGPWSILFMALFLVFYWKYFSGNWKPKTTKRFRKFCFRQIKLPVRSWIWGLVAAGALVLFLSFGLALTFRIVEFQPEVFKTARFLENLPPWMAWAFIIMASMVAGICEEIGFRGYMQTPMEEAYGRIVAIIITSLVFVIVHLHQAWAGGILVHIFVISVMIGYLAYAANSLLPGIIAHISFDIVNFSYWWSDVAGTFQHKPISVTGVDLHFMLTATILAIALLLFVMAISKLLLIRKSKG